jgi:hypothetical protein
MLLVAAPAAATIIFVATGIFIGVSFPANELFHALTPPLQRKCLAILSDTSIHDRFEFFKSFHPNFPLEFLNYFNDSYAEIYTEKDDPTNQLKAQDFGVDNTA